jgi:hypothetical protein
MMAKRIGTILATLGGSLIALTSAALAAPSSGDIIIPLTFFSSGSALLSIDPVTGDRSVLSGYDASTMLTVGSGPAFEGARAVAQCADGQLYVYDHMGDHRIVRVDPATGNRTTISDSDDPGPGQTGSGDWGDTVLCYAAQPPIVSSFSAWGLPLALGLLLGASIVHSRSAGIERPTSGGVA